MNRMVFSKFLTGEPLESIGRRLKVAGIDGMDLTVRPGGHVDPAAVEDQLPQAAADLARAGVRIGMITTGITGVDATSEKVLRAAAKLGIGYYKLGYWSYHRFGTLKQARNNAIARLKDLAALNRELNLVAGFHNHSDTFLGCNCADIAYMLDAVDSPHVGSYFDGCHATIEGGSRGWMSQLEWVIDRLVMLAVKDFHWVDGKTAYAGARRHSVMFCPLAAGDTPWPAIVEILRDRNYAGPVSFHSEYREPGHSEPWCETAQDVIDQTGKDVALFDQWWQG